MTARTELERLRAMFEQAPGMLVMVSGPEHVYELANAAYRKFLGRSDLIGRRVIDAVPELEEQGFIALLDQVYRTGEPFIGREVEIQTPGGEGRPSTRYIDFIYQPIRDGEGEVTGIFAEGHDVTEAKLARIALEPREAHFAAIFDQAAAGMAEVDLSGRFLRVNDRYCLIVGRSREELLQTKMQSITHPDDLPANLQLFKRMLETGEPFEIEKRYRHPRGTDVWVNNSVTQVVGADGEATVVAVTVDITDHKQAEELALVMSAGSSTVATLVMDLVGLDPF
jgi:PAS domain S-box-containing protein